MSMETGTSSVSLRRFVPGRAARRLRSDRGSVVTEFILLRNQGLCCFGTVPRMNEWVHVVMEEGKSAPYAMDQPITVFGTLAIGEVYEFETGKDGVERGILMSVNRMAGTVVVVPPVYR